MVSLVALVTLAVITLSFTVYHMALAVTNQTINECYKRYYLAESQSPDTRQHLDYNCYHRGVLSNLFEEFFPLQYARHHCIRKTS